MGLSVKKSVVFLTALTLIFANSVAAGESQSQKKSDINEDERFCETLTKAEKSARVN